MKTPHPLLSMLRVLILACLVLPAVPGCGLGTVDLIDNIIDEINKDDPPPPAAGDALVGIDIESGSREVVSGLNTGGGTPFLDARSAVYDKQADRVLVWEEARAAIIEVEGIDGDRSVFSDHVTGEGIALTAVRSMVLDDAGDRLVVLDNTPTGPLLVAVALASGDREVLEDLSAGSFLAIDDARGLALNSTGSFAYVGDVDRNAVVRINLSNGDRAILSGAAAGTGVAYRHLSARGAMDCAAVNVGAMVTVGGGVCRAAGIAVGACAPTPIRATAAESVLTGQELSEALIDAAAQAAAGQSLPIDDVRASAGYRRRMVQVLVKRTLTAAAERADQG